MKTPRKNIISNIFLITEELRNETPAVYEHLNETPLFISYAEKGIRMADYEQYLSSLKLQLTTFQK